MLTGIRTKQEQRILHDVNISHIPEGQLNKVLIFHFGEVF